MVRDLNTKGPSVRTLRVGEQQEHRTGSEGNARKPTEVGAGAGQSGSLVIVGGDFRTQRKIGNHEKSERGAQ